jgi:hypothetical protein
MQLLPERSALLAGHRLVHGPLRREVVAREPIRHPPLARPIELAGEHTGDDLRATRTLESMLFNHKAFETHQAYARGMPWPEYPAAMNWPRYRSFSGPSKSRTGPTCASESEPAARTDVDPHKGIVAGREAHDARLPRRSASTHKTDEKHAEPSYPFHRRLRPLFELPREHARKEGPQHRSDRGAHARVVGREHPERRRLRLAPAAEDHERRLVRRADRAREPVLEAFVRDEARRRQRRGGDGRARREDLAAHGHDAVVARKLGEQVRGVAVGGVDDVGARDRAPRRLEEPFSRRIRGGRARHGCDRGTGVQAESEGRAARFFGETVEVGDKLQRPEVVS